MTETPRELAETIVEGKEAWTDQDAVTVSAAYLELLTVLEQIRDDRPRIVLRMSETTRASEQDAASGGATTAPADGALTPRTKGEDTPEAEAATTYRVSERDAQQNADQHDIQARLK